MKTKEELLKQLDEIVELAKSKGLIKVDPKTRLPGTFMDKSDVKKDGGSIQTGISQAAAAGGVPHTTPAGSTMGAINAMGSAFGKASTIDSSSAKDMAHRLRAIYGMADNKESSISANNNPDPSMLKTSSSPDQEKGNGELGSKIDKSSTQPVNEGVSPDMIKSKKKEDFNQRSDEKDMGNGFRGGVSRSGKRHIAHYTFRDSQGSAPHDSHEEAQKWLDQQFTRLKGIHKSEALGKPVPKGVNSEKYDNCVDDVKAKSGKKVNPWAVCASSLKKDGGIQAGIAAAGAGAHPQPNAGVAGALGSAFGKSSFNKCDKLKGIIGSLKKGFVLP